LPRAPQGRQMWAAVEGAAIDEWHLSPLRGLNIF